LQSPESKVHLGALIDQEGVFNETVRSSWYHWLTETFPEAANTLSHGGIWGVDSDDWKNIGEHCLSQAAAGYVLAAALGADTDLVTQACMLHDAGKRREIEHLKSLPVEQRGAARASIESGEIEVFPLNNHDAELVTLAKANIPAQFDPDRTPLGRTAEEIIVHFLDMILVGDKFVAWELRLIEVEARGIDEFNKGFRNRYPFSDVSEFGHDLNVVQRMICAPVQDWMEQTLGLEPRTLIGWINDQLDQGPPN
jgi:hypothetical protein